MRNSREEKELDLINLDELLEDLDSFGIEAEKAIKTHKPLKPRISKKVTAKDELDKLLEDTLSYAPKTQERGRFLGETGDRHVVLHSMFKPITVIENESMKQSNQHDCGIATDSAAFTHSRSTASFPKSSEFAPKQGGWLDGAVRHSRPDSASFSSSVDRPTTAMPSQRMSNQTRPPLPDSRHASKRSIFQSAATSSLEPGASGKAWKNGML